VVPPVNPRIREMSQEYFGVVPFFVDPAAQTLIPIRYHPVTDVGADRIVNAVAAVERYGKPAIIIDLGTATTFDVVSSAGEYLGGVIAPGLAISAEALFMRAARLPRVEIKRPEKIIGSSTVESLQSGLFHGYVSLIKGLLDLIRAEAPDAKIIATGGLADSLISELPAVQHVDPDLTLQGLRIFYQRMFKEAQPVAGQLRSQKVAGQQVPGQRASGVSSRQVADQQVPSRRVPGQQVSGQEVPGQQVPDQKVRRPKGSKAS